MEPFRCKMEETYAALNMTNEQFNAVLDGRDRSQPLSYIHREKESCVCVCVCVYVYLCIVVASRRRIRLSNRHTNTHTYTHTQWYTHIFLFLFRVFYSFSFHNDDDDEFYLSMRSAFISMAITFVIDCGFHQVFVSRSLIPPHLSPQN